MRSIAVFCGSKVGRDPAFAAATQVLGGAMASRGLGLVYGGGNVGLMGVLADAVLAGGGRVVGVIPRFLVDRELAHRGCQEMVLTDTMHERKAAMAERCDAFLALPGGFGTMDEVFEALTWRQLGLHDKPVGLLDVNGYFAALLALLDRFVAEELLLPVNRALLAVERAPLALLDRLVAAMPVAEGGRFEGERA